MPDSAYHPGEYDGPKLDRITWHLSAIRFYLGVLTVLFVGAALLVMTGVVQLQVKIEGF